MPQQAFDPSPDTSTTLTAGPVLDGGLDGSLDGAALLQPSSQVDASRHISQKVVRPPGSDRIFFLTIVPSTSPRSKPKASATGTFTW